ncbi:MAG: MBL fold metallo-hydrolase [Myxococcota bacterium]
MKRLLYSLEGNARKLDGGFVFGGAPRALWERFSNPDPEHRVDIASRCLLVREPARWILFDTGFGAWFDPRRQKRLGAHDTAHTLLGGLRALGLSHEDIDVVVLSHLQQGRAGGLLSAWTDAAAPSMLFPSATLVVSQPAWHRAQRPHVRDRGWYLPELVDHLARHPRVERVPRGSHSATLGRAYSLHFCDGHSPGQMLTEIPGTLGPVVVASDLVPGRAWVHRSITSGADRFPELLIDEKIALLDDLAARGGRLFFSADPACAMARITRDERGRYGSVSDRRILSGVEA